MRNKPLPTLLYRSIAAVSLLLSMLCGGSVTAQTYYMPGSNYGFTGGANSWPLSAGLAGGSNMCQWLYLPGDFNTVPTANVLITTIYLKPASTGSFSYTNLSIKLGNTTLTTLTNGTWNSGLTTVYSPASVTLSTTASSWYAITLTTPFLYTVGSNILLEITHQNTTGIGTGTTLNQYSVSGRNGRMYGMNTSASSAGADVATACFGFDSVPAACSGLPTAGNITTAPFAAASPLCAGNTTTITGVDPNGGINGLIYQWQSAPSATGPWTNVTGGSGATTLTYTTGPVTVSTYYRLGIICTNSSLTAYSAPFLVPVGTPQPGPISGRPTFCPGDVAVYSVPNVAGTTYSWTLPPGWTTSLPASTTNSITVTMGGTNAGTLSVTATSACGPTSISRSQNILPGSAPATPAVINGSNAVCAGSTQTYSVTPVVGAVAYIWTLPSGWTGTSSGPSITLTTGTANGTLMVKSSNGCGNSTDATLAISIINSLANPGPISGPATVCSGTLQNYSISPVSGATSYVWTLPSGWSGTTTGTSIQAFAGAAGGPINVTAYVSCATSSISTLSATVTPSVTPTVSIATPPAICQNALTTFNAAATNTGTAPVYQWKKNGLNVLAVGPTYTDNTLVSGDLISVVLTSNATCTVSPTTTSNVITAAVTPAVTPGISINTVPPIVMCAGTPISFVTTATGGGTAPTYQWYLNNVAISGQTGTTFNTSTLSNGDTLTIRMTTNASCATAPVALSNKVGFRVNPAVLPSVTVSASSVTGGTGEYVTFTAAQSGGGATPAYQWILNGVDIPGEQRDTYTSNTLMPGDHVSVRLQSYDPCANPGVVTSNEVILQGASTGVGSVSGTWSGSVKLYPNPSNGAITVLLQGSVSGNKVQGVVKLRMEVVNVLGQRVYLKESAIPVGTSSGSEQRYEVNVGGSVPSGQYQLRLSSVEGSLQAALPFVISR